MNRTVSGSPSQDFDGPLLSVIVPSHNVEPWIEELLHSILEQSVELEVIVVDDHSADRTRALLHNIAEVDHRLLLIDADNRGGANARNLGLAAARGRYVAFADADDVVPPGAYKALVDSLEKSGSDIAFGDFLKFSSTRTWQPSKNWHAFDTSRSRLRLVEEPSLVRGRAVWNKVFRRAFLASIGLSFPEVARSNDIVPMTQAYVRAQLIDIVADCVYLYRDRPGLSSMTSRAGAAAAAISYFGQEAECARLIGGLRSEQVSGVYSSLIFDADGWVHLSRYLLGLATGTEIDADALRSVKALVAQTSWRGFTRASPHKQILWALVVRDELDLAWRFNQAEEAARESGSYDEAALSAWCAAVSTLTSADPHDEFLDANRMAEGFLTLLVQQASIVSEVQLSGALSGLSTEARDLFGRVTVENPVLGLAATAIATMDVSGLRAVSRHRNSPLIADLARSQGVSAFLSGAVVVDSSTELAVTAVDQANGRRVELGPIDVVAERWNLEIPHSVLGIGRWELRARFAAGQTVVEQPVVTARMPLPLVGRADRIRILSDRSRRWTVVLDVRRSPEQRALRRLGGRVKRVLLKGAD